MKAIITPTLKSAYILDNHTLFAECLGKTLEGYHLFDCIETFSSEKELLKHLLHLKSRLATCYLFMDYYIGNVTLPTIVSDLRKVLKNPKVIVVSGITNPLLLKQLIRIRPDGIIHKSDKTWEIIDCIGEVNQGSHYYTEHIQEILNETPLKSGDLPFSHREMEVLGMFAQGFTITNTARRMQLSKHTISAHRRRMFNKTQCRNISELLAFARNLEII